MKVFREANNRRSAFLFYLGYCLLMLLLTALIGGPMYAAFGVSFQTSLILGNSPAVLLCLGLGILVVQSKGHLDNFGYWCFILMGGIMAAFTSGLGGMIPVAYLTTHPPAPETYWNIEDEEDWQREENVPLDRL